MKWSQPRTPLVGITLLAAALLSYHARSAHPTAAQEPSAQAPSAQEPSAQAPSAQTPAASQEQVEPTVQAPTRPRRPILSTAEATKRYEAAMDRWRESLKEITRVKVHFSISKPSEKEKYIEEWIDAINAHFDAFDEVHKTGADAYAAKYQPLGRLEQFLLILAQHDVMNGRFDEAYQLLTSMVDAGCSQTKIDTLLGNAALFSNHFAEAKTALIRGKEKNILGPEGEGWLEYLDPLIAAWAVELELRAKEAEADDLPRVLLHTTQGDIVIELFENEAPDTVGNFISLVEKGFYDGLDFFRVERSVVAQTGCPLNNGKGTPGYSIYCECFQENRRHRFGGSVVMAKMATRDGELVPNSAGSQFFIDARPAPIPEGPEFTVFGRVIDGFSRVSRLQIKGEKEEDKEKPPTVSLPDRIISAKVLRKRKHEYLPNKVQN